MTLKRVSLFQLVVRTGFEPVKYGEFIRCTHTFNITTQASTNSAT